MADDLQKLPDNLQYDLDNTSIPKEVSDEIIAKETEKGIRGAVLESLGLGSIEKIFNVAESIEQANIEYKKGLLMQTYVGKTENLEKQIAKLETLVTSAEGNILFNKIVRIVNNNAEDRKYIDILGGTLKKITDADFKKLFSKYIYALNQIDKLTPQALILLMDYENWPEFPMTRYSSDRGVITSEWIETFLAYYTQIKAITADYEARRIANALRELSRSGLIRAKMKNETDSKDMGALREANSPTLCEPTELGKEIIEYIE